MDFRSFMRRAKELGINEDKALYIWNVYGSKGVELYLENVIRSKT